MLEYKKKLYSIDIVDFLVLAKSNNNSLFTDVKDMTDDVMTNCPFHGADNNPSFGIKKENGVAHCFSCGYSNDFSGFVEDLGLDYLFGDLQPKNQERKISIFTKPKKTILKSLPNPYKNNTTLFWRRRGISKDIKDLFELGYDPITDEVTFPIKTLGGKITGFIRRSASSKSFHVDKELSKILYGMHEVMLTNYIRHDIIVVESNTDALYLWTLGYPAIALNGTGSKTQMSSLEKTHFKKLILMLDNDEAGRRGVQKILNEVKGKFFSIVRYPEGVKDANDMTREQIKNSLEEVGYFETQKDN